MLLRCDRVLIGFWDETVEDEGAGGSAGWVLSLPVAGGGSDTSDRGGRERGVSQDHAGIRGLLRSEGVDLLLDVQSFPHVDRSSTTTWYPADG